MVISTSKHLKKQEKAQMIQHIESFSDRKISSNYRQFNLNIAVNLIY